MSEKRFEKSKPDITDYMIYDYEKEDAYFIDCDDESTVDAIVDLLNELCEENEQLRQFINKGRRLSVKELINNANENELLKKENEQLKLKIDGLEYALKNIKMIDVEIDLNE